MKKARTGAGLDNDVGFGVAPARPANACEIQGMASPREVALLPPLARVLLEDRWATPGPIRLTSSQAHDIHTDEEGDSTLASSGHESSSMDPGAHGGRGTPALLAPS